MSRKSRLGAATELKVAADLIKKGFQFFISLVFVYMVLILPSHVLVTKMRRLEEKWLQLS